MSKNINFKTKGKEIVDNEIPSKWLEVGSTQIVKLKNAEYFTTPNGSEGIRFLYVGKPVEGLTYDLNGTKVNTPKVEDTRWVTEKAWEYTQNVLVHLANILNCRNEFDNEMDSVSSSEDVVKIINKLFANKPFAMNIFGEQIALLDEETGQTNIWTKPVVNFSFHKNSGTLETLEVLQSIMNDLKVKDKVVKKLEVEESPFKEETIDGDSSLDW